MPHGQVGMSRSPEAAAFLLFLLEITLLLWDAVGSPLRYTSLTLPDAVEFLREVLYCKMLLREGVMLSLLTQAGACLWQLRGMESLVAAR